MSKIEEHLVLNHSLYGRGSRIIITTTNEEVLLAIKVQCERDGKFDVYEKYEPRLMGKEDALELFSWCAFRRESPPDDYLDLAEEVISHAGGLPLVLKTLGSLLFIEDDKVYWKEKLEKLREVPPTEVVKRLKISFDALDFGQKQIYLDIACFFVGHDVTIPSYMWNACGFHASEGIRALERRSLIKLVIKKDRVHNKPVIYVPNELRELQRQTTNSVHKLEDDKKVIWMHDQLRELGRQIINRSFVNPLEWSRLWVQREVMERYETPQEEEYKHASFLQFNEPFFSLAHGAPSNYFSQIFRYVHGRQDSYLHVTGKEFEMLPNLRYFQTGYYDLHDFKSIRWLGWSGNSAPSNLYLKNIIILNISNSFINPKWKWWNEIKMAEKLEVLILSRNYFLKHIPHLSNLVSVKRLDLYECGFLERLDGLEQLTSLTYLNVSYCRNLKTMPDLSKLRKLRTLKMYLNWSLVMVEGLESLELLELLDVHGCGHLQTLPDLSNLHNLSSFKAYECNQLTGVQGLSRLVSLEHFHMIRCPAMKRYPNVSNSKKLKTLLKCFSEVSEVEGLGELEALEKLIIYSTECLHILPRLSKLTRLRRLEIYGCHKLSEIQSLQGLESLKYFNMTLCSTVRLITFAHLKMLQCVRIWSCGHLSAIHGLEDSDSLKVLTIIACCSFEKIPDLSGLKKLWCINLIRCKKLTEIQGLEQLTSLRTLRVVECGSLVKNLPSFVTFSDEYYWWSQDEILFEDEDEDEDELY